jgi:uncharacterized membrane protein
VWNNVGSATVEGVQGRYFLPLLAYFLPLLALVAAMWCSVARVPLSRQASSAALLMLAAAIIAEHAITVLTIVKVYHVF